MLEIWRCVESLMIFNQTQRGPKVTFNWFQFVAFGVAAVFVCSAFGIYLLNLGSNDNPDTFVLEAGQSSIAFEEDPESPIHGVTVAELEKRSGLPVGGGHLYFRKDCSIV